jgi:hypothetical protein
MKTRLGDISSAYNLMDSDDETDALILTKWILTRRDRIQTVSPSLWHCMWHVLNFGYPELSADEALRTMLHALSNGYDHTEYTNAMDTAKDLADLIISYDIDSDM